MKIELLYFDGCPNWHIAYARLTEALNRAGLHDQTVDLLQVTTDEQARTLSFPGSPTILIDNQDLFPHPASPHSLSCRVYTASGLAGSPTVDQLLEAISAAAR